MKEEITAKELIILVLIYSKNLSKSWIESGKNYFAKILTKFSCTQMSSLDTQTTILITYWILNIFVTYLKTIQIYQLFKPN